MPLEERKYKDLKEQSFGDQGWQGEQAKICGVYHVPNWYVENYFHKDASFEKQNLA